MCIVLFELRSALILSIRKVFHRHLSCKLFKAKCGKQMEAPLPCAPLTITGIVFAGPILGRALLDEECLPTVLFGIEAALNSRPLVNEEEIDDSSAALILAHFLTGRTETAIPSRLENIRLN
ncbi:hypothetical protein TNIN_165171 [Trichonephila inaurata madagascariensis]|uniref:Uncharacterized protein n=1 Tax=Trichonephila inaurata madagascariensis TaxID=2747483 RepID=A0A8X6IF71_9ARAC|nr:hypothetical protein TNIN_165171 [Trichonephila inaurata madagascariensis]